MSKLDNETDSGNQDKSDELRIAWRYGQQQTPKSSLQEQSKILQPNYFVINKMMGEEVNNSIIKGFELCDTELIKDSSDSNLIYSKLANDLSTQIDALNLNVTKTKKYSNILRIRKKLKLRLKIFILTL